MARKKSQPKKVSAKVQPQTLSEEGKIVGRPRAISSVEELEERIVSYLNTLGKYQLPTKAGLSFCLGVHRDTLNKYEKEEPFSDILKHWYSWFEDRWVQNLSRPNATGTIFYLKNTYGYVDKQETDHTSGGKPIQYVVPKEIAEKHQIHFIEIEKEKNGASPETEGSSE